MKLGFSTHLTALTLLVFSMPSVAAPTAPTLFHSISGLNITITWTNVPDTTEYILSYAPDPFTGPDSIVSLNVGGQTNFSASLWEGAAFFIAVQAINDQGISDFSNIENFAISKSTADIAGSWNMHLTIGPNTCGDNPEFNFDFSAKITQAGTSIEGRFGFIEDYGGGDLVGDLAGNTASFSRESSVINLSVLPDNKVSGSVSYTSLNDEGNGFCSGVGSITGFKL